MKRFSLIFAVASALVLVPASAMAEKPGKVGVGLGAGTVSNGLSGKYYMSDKIAAQLIVGTFGAGGASERYKDLGGLGVGLDVLIENAALVKTPIFSLDWNYGVGAGLGIRNDTFGLAAAGVLGLELNFIPVPIDLVVEYRPTLAIQPDVDFEPVDFTVHLRYYFK